MENITQYLIRSCIWKLINAWQLGLSNLNLAPDFHQLLLFCLDFRRGIHSLQLLPFLSHFSLLPFLFYFFFQLLLNRNFFQKFFLLLPECRDRLQIQDSGSTRRKISFQPLNIRCCLHFEQRWTSANAKHASKKKISLEAPSAEWTQIARQRSQKFNKKKKKKVVVFIFTIRGGGGGDHDLAHHDDDAPRKPWAHSEITVSTLTTVSGGQHTSMLEMIVAGSV